MKKRVFDLIGTIIGVLILDCIFVLGVVFLYRLIELIRGIV